jgi:hypothetical protein
MQKGELTCLMCGTVVGDFNRGRFVHHPGCDRLVGQQAGLPRCCRCGGSLYFDPILTFNSPARYINPRLLKEL